MVDGHDQVHAAAAEHRCTEERPRVVVERWYSTITVIATVRSVTSRYLSVTPLFKRPFQIFYIDNFTERLPDQFLLRQTNQFCQCRVASRDDVVGTTNQNPVL